MSDLQKRIGAVLRSMPAKPKYLFKDMHPLQPLEFTKIRQAGGHADILTKAWNETIDEYEQEHQDELQKYLGKTTPPPWRTLILPETRIGREIRGLELKDKLDKRDEEKLEQLREQYAKENGLKHELTQRALKRYKELEREIA